MRIVKLSIILVTLLFCPAFSQTTYNVTDLGVLDGYDSSWAGSINNSSQVLGVSKKAAGGAKSVFLWDSEGMTGLSSLQVDDTVEYDINGSGQVAGTSEAQACLYEDGSVTKLGTLGGGLSKAFGINDNIQIVGQSETSSSNIHAFLYESGGMTGLGTLGGNNSRARGINNSGYVVGGAQNDSGDLRAFVYNGTTMSGLGTLGGDSSEAFAINDDGQIVGDSKYSSFYSHAFFYDNGTMTDLGTFGGPESRALDINGSSQIVGWANIASWDDRAFLYEDGELLNLNDLIDGSYSDWILEQAYSINDSGQIVGRGVSPSGDQRAFLLSPVPEPATVSLLGLGTLIYLRRRKSSGKQN